MKSATNKPGSVLMMVVGVLAALALMGSVFLLVTWNDKKEALVINEAAPMRPIAESQVMRVVGALKDDLFIGATGPYSRNTVKGVAIPGGDQWKKYIDYPSADPNWGPFDRHLASIERAWANGTNITAGNWPKITNLGDLPPGADVDVRPDGQTHADWRSQVVNATIPPNDTPDGTHDYLTMVDADGDGIPDSALFNAGVGDKSGKQYWAAVRVVDLSGLVNINTAYSVGTPLAVAMSAGMVTPQNIPQDQIQSVAPAPPLPDPIPAAGIFPMNSANNIVHLARLGNPAASPGWMTDWLTFNQNVIRQVDSPNRSAALPYRPFDWSDEFACRWADSFDPDYGPNVAPGPKMAHCRLNTCFGNPMASNEWIRYSRYLTTCSVSRNFTRLGPNSSIAGPLPISGANPRDGNSVAWAPLLTKVPLNMSLSTAIVTDANIVPGETLAANVMATMTYKELAFHCYRRAFYQMLSASVPSMGINSDGDRKRAAVQLALNLIDFRDGDGIPTVLDCTKPEGASLDPSSLTGQYFGIEPQPFITEAWYSYVLASGPPATISSPHMAIVLNNPYDFKIDVSGWTLNHGGPLPAGTVINARSKLVIANFLIPAANLDSSATQIQMNNLIEDPTWSQLSSGWQLTLSRPSRNFSEVDPSAPVSVARFDVNTFGGKNPEAIFSNAASAAGTYIGLSGRNDSEYLMTSAGWVDETTGPPFPTPPDYTTPLPPPTPPTPPLLPLHLLGAPNGAPTPSTEMPVFVRGYAPGVPGPLPPSDIVNLADLARIYYVGPNASTPVNDALSGTIGQPDAGRIGPTNIDGSTGLSPLARAADFFTVDNPAADGVDNDGDGSTDASYSNANLQAWNHEMGVWGKININTAPLAALCALPGAPQDGVLQTLVAKADRIRMAAEITAYRDLLASFAGGTTSYASGRTGGLRQISPPLPSNWGGFNTAGFASTGEVIFPMNSLPKLTFSGGAGYAPAYAVGVGGSDDGFSTTVSPPLSDLSKDLMRYAYLSNLITVNSDVYCAYVYVQMGLGSPWQAGMQYNLGDMVTVAVNVFPGFRVYSCIIGHPSGASFQADSPATNWKEMSGWAAATNYVPGQLVSYGGKFYLFQAPAAHPSTNNFLNDYRVSGWWYEVPVIKRNYIAIIDRSNCITSTDQPIVRAFAEVK